MTNLLFSLAVLALATAFAKPSIASQCNELQGLRKDIAIKVKHLKQSRGADKASLKASLKSELEQLLQAGETHICNSRIVHQTLDAFEIRYSESAIDRDTFNLKKDGLPVSWQRTFRSGLTQIINF